MIENDKVRHFLGGLGIMLALGVLTNSGPFFWLAIIISIASPFAWKIARKRPITDQDGRWDIISTLIGVGLGLVVVLLTRLIP